MKHLMREWQVGDGREERLAQYVAERARPNDPADVIRVIDDYAYNESFLINVGDEKGQILDAALRKVGAKRVLELGTYCGYSALRMAVAAPQSAIVSIELNPANAGIARRIWQHAGVSNRVSAVVGTLGDGGTTVRKLRDDGFTEGSLDFVFLDHDKDGICGMKPTWGLVPYTGIMPIEIFVDHTGPMTANVADNALLLEVIAGDDGYDPRIKTPTVHRYSEALGGGVRGLRVAVLQEGFAQPGAEPAVNEKVQAAARRFRDLGATVEEVSIPMHLVASAIWTPIGVEGLVQTMLWGDGYGLSRSDLYAVSLMDTHRRWRQRANELSETTKLFLMLGTYVLEQHGPRYYGKAMNVARRLTAAYDQALAQYDLLLMPTTPIKATPLPGPEASREEIVQRSLEMIGNTSPFDITHHPAMSIPCGMVDGLPIGLMLVGKHFDEPTIYRAAHAFEHSADWKTM